MKRTFQDFIDSGIANDLGLCPTDTRFRDILNMATEILLTRGHWEGSVGRFRFCATDGCITLPPQVAALEGVNVCGQNVPIFDYCYEFMGNGPGTISGWGQNTTGNSTCCGQGGGCMVGAIMRGRFPTYSDIIPTGKKLKAVCDLPTDVGKKALYLGFDDNGNWIRTLQSGVYSDGELIAFAQSAGTLSVNNFSSVSAVQLPNNMDGQSWLYEYNVAATTSRLIAQYQSWEVRPNYSRFYLPGILTAGSGTPCTQTLVEALVKLEFVPVKNPTDFVIIGCLPALWVMCMHVSSAKKEPDATKKAQILATGIQLAVNMLDAELDHVMGSGRRMGISVMGSNIGAVDPVPTLE